MGRWQQKQGCDERDSEFCVGRSSGAPGALQHCPTLDRLPYTCTEPSLHGATTEMGGAEGR